VVEALIATQPLHAVCSAFLTRIDDSGVSVATSDLLPFELAEAAFAIALKERWGGTWRRHRPDGRARRPAARLLNDTIARYETLKRLDARAARAAAAQAGTRVAFLSLVCSYPTGRSPAQPDAFEHDYRSQKPRTDRSSFGRSPIAPLDDRLSLALAWRCESCHLGAHQFSSSS
jgi:hypothetical protein